MESIEAQFNEEFAAAGIRLPPEHVAGRKRGKIVHKSWVIWYLFGSNANGEYLDYYASNRFTTDSHTRIYADGVEEVLPSYRSMYIKTEDPAENARREEEVYAENHEVSRMLAAKGFCVEGDEPGALLINRLLCTEKVSKDGHAGRTGEVHETSAFAKRLRRDRRE